MNLDQVREGFERAGLGEPSHTLILSLHEGAREDDGFEHQAHLAVLPDQEAWSKLSDREQQGVAHILRKLADSLDPQRNLPDDTQIPRHLDPAILARFREEGLLWLVNTSVLHPRGWALAVQVDDTGEPESLGVYRFGEYTIFEDKTGLSGYLKYQEGEWEREGGENQMPQFESDD